MCACSRRYHLQFRGYALYIALIPLTAHDRHLSAVLQVGAPPSDAGAQRRLPRPLSCGDAAPRVGPRSLRRAGEWLQWQALLIGLAVDDVGRNGPRSLWTYAPQSVY